METSEEYQFNQVEKQHYHQADSCQFVKTFITSAFTMRESESIVGAADLLDIQLCNEQGKFANQHQHLHQLKYHPFRNIFPTITELECHIPIA